MHWLLIYALYNAPSIRKKVKNKKKIGCSIKIVCGSHHVLLKSQDCGKFT